MISRTEIQSFKKKFDVVGVFIEYNGEILLLHRQDSESEGNTWGSLAGKVEQGEDLQGALVREIKEEIGLTVKPDDCIYIEKYYVRYPKFDFIYHLYHLSLNERPTIDLNLEEHKEYKWIKPKDALRLDLIEDEDACIKWFYGIS